MVTKIKEILEQFDIKLNLTEEMLNIEINDDDFQSYYTEIDMGWKTYVFVKKFRCLGRDATRKVIINPEKQIVVSLIDRGDNLRNITTYYDKYGKIKGI